MTRKESSVRKWVREHLSFDYAIALEPGFGGDFGLPDYMVRLDNGKPAFLELKRDDSLKSLRLRPSQKKIARKAIIWGIPYFVFCRSGKRFALYRVVEIAVMSEEPEFLFCRWVEEKETVFIQVLRDEGLK